jgi:hypothetical protein
MVDKKILIRLTKIGRGINEGYDTISFAQGVELKRDGKLTVNLTSYPNMAMQFDQSEDEEVIANFINLIKKCIRRDVMANKIEGRVSDWKVESVTLKMEIECN